MDASWKVALILTGTMIAVLGSYAGEASAALYCGRPYSQLKRNPDRPYNAVGLLNNGCTAFLIDADHIVAAGHCFTNTLTGEWQTGLRFYPNFHPLRVFLHKKDVPRADVIRVVVGSRAGGDTLGIGMDWGIARLANWQDAAGLDLTPVSLAGAIPANGAALSNPAYTRHHFPYDDSDAVAWDNMEWDTTNCGWVGDNHGMWAIKMGKAPIYDGVHRDTVACNSRWAAGMIHDNCSLTDVIDDVVYHDCDTIGGSSGSPIMHKDAAGKWSVIGVGHGFSSPDFSDLAPACLPDTPGNENAAVSVDRFRFAPRFASNVAVNRSPVDAVGTAVFAVDSDLNRVVYRYREGAAPTYESDFTFWRNLGSPYQGAKLSRIAACSANTSGLPQVFVVTDQQKIYTRSAIGLNIWGAWSSFGIPGAASSVGDLDTTVDAKGRCMVLMVADGGKAFARSKTAGGAWGSWSSVAGGSYKAVTALNYSSTVWAALLDTSGEIWRTSLGPAGWSARVKLPLPAQIGAWRDIDLTWDELGRGFMLAIPSQWNVSANATNALWFTPLYGNPWLDWYTFETHLWAPGAPIQRPPKLRSITASRWLEDPPGTTSPVVFATDDNGNIYLVDYARVGTVGWNLNWRSFYHEYVPYP